MTAPLTYEELRESGIVSGFGVISGDPLANRNRISRIDTAEIYPNREGPVRCG